MQGDISLLRRDSSTEIVEESWLYTYGLRASTVVSILSLLLLTASLASAVFTAELQEVAFFQHTKCNF